MSRLMKDVAERANVSITTVSHVMNRTRFVAPKTRKRVLEAIQELNYFKDAHARRLAAGRSDFFGLIVSDIQNPFFPEIIFSFETAALDEGYEVLLSNTNYDPKRTEAAVRKMIENKVRGVAVMTSEFSPDLTAQLTLNQVAVVFLDLGRAQPFMSTIQVNYSDGIFQAINHLHDLGHQDIAFISGPQSLCSAVIRRQAFIDALTRWGLPSNWLLEGNHKVDGGIATVRTLLRSAPLPTAIFCSNDLTAIGAMSALQEAGLRVPADISVVGFDDISFSSIAAPPLTTISLSRNRLGKLALEALHNLLRKKSRQGRKYIVETQLVVRRSSARVNRERQHLPITNLEPTHRVEA